MSSENRALFSRRSFLRWSQSAMAMFGAAPFLSKTAEAAAPASSVTDYYDKLGVAKIINAAGTYTTLTAACMPPQVRRAVELAAQHPVQLHDLQVKSGEYLAKKLRCEGALVTSGASGAITLATAACITYANNSKPGALPQDAGNLKNEVIVQKSHRYSYDHAMMLSGAVIREVVTLDDYKRAFNEKTVMTNFFNAAEEEDGPVAQIGREQWLEIAHQHNVPCHMDAAADMPPIENLWKYTGMGFDLVCFSGGKGIRGPQNAGLLLGKKHLTDLALRNTNPNGDAVGRGMKVAKEQIVGMVAAVDWLLEQSDESNEREYNRRCKVISDAVKNIPTMQSSVVIPKIANHVPHLLLKFDPAKVGVTVAQVQERLRAQNPPIELNPNTGHKPNQGIPSDANTLVIGVWMLQPGEDEIVGRRLRAALTQKA
ncbi:selenocysteine synthase [Edaphobacter flagellatus]|uniref:selenocysteine synthase n=1 Tax=Edaphobacter flagellatus TaxID=1933044 RepID=UPI0021B1F8BC|nr:selenocysteine synthase [Edaphobacter flagellatus]